MRAHWVQVAAIALVIALGTGTFAGLGSTARWRELSADASFALLGFRDLEVELSEGSFVPEGRLAGALEGVEAGTDRRHRRAAQSPHPGGCQHAGPDDPRPGRGHRAAARRGPGPASTASRSWRAGLSPGRTRATPVVLLERNFAEYYDLAAAGSLSIAGGRELAYVGRAASPEYFVVMPEDGSGFFLQANFAALFTSLETAQDLGGVPGGVNRLLVRLTEGADPGQAERAVAGSPGGAAPRRRGHGGAPGRAARPTP